MGVKKEASMIHDLTDGKVSEQLIKFAAPLLLSGFLQTLYNIVDMIIVGQFVGKNGMSAIAIGGDILTFLTFAAIGFCNAGQVIISQYVGAGEKEKVKNLVGTMFTLLPICALLLSVICLFNRTSILTWMNTAEEVWNYAYQYTTVCMAGLFFIYGYNMVSAVLRGMGDSKHPFFFIGFAAVLNIFFDLLFVVGFHWEAFGAALGTVLSQGLSFILSILFLYIKREKFGFDFKLKSFGMKPDVTPSLLKLGVPMMLQLAAVEFSKLYVNSWVNSYGTVATAVNGAGSKLMTITNVFSQAFSTAGASMIGQSIGAEKYERVPRVLSVSFGLIGAVAVVVSFFTVGFPKAVFGLFTTDKEVQELAMSYVPVLLVLYLGCVLRPPMFALINGSGNSKLNFFVALLDGIIARIGFALFLGIICNMGLFGFWYGNALAGTVPFFVGAAYYLSGKWKTRKYLIQK